ncbi:MULTISPECIES: hypothetical protein [Mumia]|uniref:hypothetical protein n=1 Tax=Mumia TaxID=1546255 RepID=UPI0013D6812F|nr:MULTISPECIES: hypothetical protein [Mumia]
MRPGPQHRPLGVDRRRLLVGGGLLTLVAVSGCSWLDRTPSTPDPEVHPDHGLLADARQQQADLLDAVRTTAATHAALATALAPLVARAEERLAELDRAVGDPTATPPSAGTSPTSASPTPVPARPAAAVRALATRSQEAQAARREDCGAATDQGVARLLASLSAGYAQDAVVLRTTRAAA